MANPLTDVLPAKARKIAYLVYGLVGVVIGAVQVAYATSQGAQPTALTVALAVYGYLGIALGFTAAANTPPD